MIYAGNAIQVEMHDHQLAKLTFDLKHQSINKLNVATLLNCNKPLLPSAVMAV